MSKADKTKKGAKKEKTASKAAQNRLKTRENLAEKKEPSCAAQMMQAHGKAKLVKELQEHRAEQKAEERHSEQAQAIDTLSEEAEVTAGAVIEEGIGLLERDLQRLQEWRHAEPPPLPPLEEVPPASELVYPISPPKSDKPRKLPSRQVSRFSSTTSTVKTKPVRSIPTGRVTLSPKKPTSQAQVSQLMQVRGKLLFRRKRMQAQRVKLQRRHETAYSAHESTVLKEIYPIAERSITSPKPPGRPVSQAPISQNYTPKTPDYRRIGASPQKSAPISAQDKRRLIMQKRQETKYQATDYPISAHPRGNELGIAESLKLSTCSTEPVKISQNSEFTEFRAGRAIQKPVIEPSGSPQTQIPMAQERRKLVLKRRTEEHRYTAMLDQKTAPLGTEYERNHAKSLEFVQVRTPTVQERRRMVLKKRLGAHRYTLDSNPAIEVFSPNFEENRAEKSVSTQIRAPTAQERRKLVLRKRLDTHQDTVKLEQESGFPAIDFEKNHVGSSQFLQKRPITVQECRKLILCKRSNRQYIVKTAQSLPISNENEDKMSPQKPESVQMCCTSKERRKMVMSKRQTSKTASESEFPLAPAKQKVCTATGYPSSKSVFLEGSFSPIPASMNPISAQRSLLPTENPAQSSVVNLTYRNGRKPLPTARTAQPKSLIMREKLLQSKKKVRLPKYQHTSAKAAYQRAFYIRQASQGKKVIRCGLVALANSLQRLIKAGISTVKNAGAGAFACIILLSLVLMVGMAGALAGSPFGVLFSPQETSPEAKSVGAAVAEANNEYFGKVTDIINNTEHDELVIHRVPSDGAADTRLRTWEEILAVFAVKTTTDPANATDVVMIDDDRTDRLKEVLWDMVSVSKRVETTGHDEDETKTLHLTITVKTPDEAARDYRFNQMQTGALAEMLLPENKALLTELIGWATGTGGAESVGGVGNINDYEVPPEALSDERFAAILNEAKKYLGMPYVWGGSSPSTSFDCSGFVCWVLNKSGAMSIERTTATGIYNRCTVIPGSEAKPGDLIFFTGTYNSPGPISHIGIYVGDGMMVHCGDPIQFTSTESKYWRDHFYAFTRIP